MTYVDIPKKMKHFDYGHKIKKLYKQHCNSFKPETFQDMRKTSTHHNLLESLGRIGKCVNDTDPNTIPVDGLDEVCFILCNTYEYRADWNLGVGPLNDAYMIALSHHRRGFKIFFLYEPRKQEFIDYCKFFLQNTTKALTIFYSGRATAYCGSCGGKIVSNIGAIVFINQDTLIADELSRILARYSNGQSKIVLITDCCNGNAPWNLIFAHKDNKNLTGKIVVFNVAKHGSTEDWKRDEKIHGIFTFYFCKTIDEFPSITPAELIRKMNARLKRFDESIIYAQSSESMKNTPIFESY